MANLMRLPQHERRDALETLSVAEAVRKFGFSDTYWAYLDLRNTLSTSDGTAEERVWHDNAEEVARLLGQARLRYWIAVGMASLIASLLAVSIVMGTGNGYAPLIAGAVMLALPVAVLVTRARTFLRVLALAALFGCAGLLAVQYYNYSHFGTWQELYIWEMVPMPEVEIPGSAWLQSMIMRLFLSIRLIPLTWQVAGVAVVSLVLSYILRDWRPPRLAQGRH